MKRRSVVAGLFGAVGAGGAWGRAAESRAATADARADRAERSSVAGSACGPSPEVDSVAGRLRGRMDRGVAVFSGIPYGASPHGQRRFLPAEAAPAWQGTRNALVMPPIAPQENSAEKTRLFTAGGYPGCLPTHNEQISEDCLHLNLWTPSVASDRARPVMVWLHGGSFIGGSGNGDWYDGAALSRRGDVVVVNVNHRLGTLGFLYLGDHGGAELASSGLLGLLDIVLALQWVQKNVRRFGGDPDNVTLFGESGGGLKISALLAMPVAKGLFHKAIIQSGAGVHMHTREQASRVTELMLTELGLSKPSLATLQALPIDQIIAAQQRLVKKVRGGALPGVGIEYRPVIDGTLLPQHPFDPGAPLVSANVPLIIGTNATEATWGLWSDADAQAIDSYERLVVRLTKDLGRDASAAVDHYRRMYPRDPPLELFIRIKSSPHNSITIAERKSDQRAASAYAYLFAWETPAYGGRLRSPHMLEVPFVFDNVSIAHEFTGGGPEARALAATMSQAWISFAHRGEPTAPGLTRWAPYTRAERQTMIFDRESRLVRDPESKARMFWQT